MKPEAVKILKVDFLEGVLTPKVQGVAEYVEKFRQTDNSKLKLRTFGPGLLMEADGATQATIIPWGNVRSALIELPAEDSKKQT